MNYTKSAIAGRRGIPMKIAFHKKRAFTGELPGEIVIEENMPKPVITVMDYNKEHYTFRENVKDIESLADIPEGIVRWIDIQGVGDRSILESIQSVFQIHPLVMEDVVNVPQRVKADFFQAYLFLILKMFYPTKNGQYTEEQLSMITGEHFVITFQERAGDCLDPLRRRIENAKGIIRNMGADYLAFAITDTIFDHYFPFLQRLSETIEDLEERVGEDPQEKELKEIQEAKHTLISLKRELWPSREVMSRILREPGSLITDQVKVYFRDCYDHIVQILELTESLKELTTELMNIYLSVQGNKLNEIMKVLTIISTIFIPLSFLVGLYGMNFDNIPELGFEYGYFVVIAVMATIVVSMLIWFKKKGWIGKKKK